MIALAFDAQRPHAAPQPRWWHAPGRALALFLGLFILLNLLGERFTPGFDLNVWWIDIRPLPPALGQGLLLVGAGVLIYQGVRRLPAYAQTAGQVVLLALTAMAVVNAGEFYVLASRGVIQAGFPVPLSAFIAAALAGVWWQMRTPAARMSRWGRVGFIATLALCAVGFPLLQILCFGYTSYRRRADAAVVFGAKVNADGYPSRVLADRTQTAIRLYQAGWVHTLIFSGGPCSDPSSPWTEPKAMRQMALAAGVPESAIILDEAGLSTDATVRNTAALFRDRHFTRVLAVSHDYHLPRIKMRYQRELGEKIEVLTVPAEEAEGLPHRSFFIAREVAALWAYYLRPLVP